MFFSPFVFRVLCDGTGPPHSRRRRRGPIVNHHFLSTLTNGLLISICLGYSVNVPARCVSISKSLPGSGGLPVGPQPTAGRTQTAFWGSRVRRGHGPAEVARVLHTNLGEPFVLELVLNRPSSWNAAENLSTCCETRIFGSVSYQTDDPRSLK